MREIKFRAFHNNTKQMYMFDITWGNYGQGNGYIGMIPFGESIDYGSFFISKGNREMIDPNDCVLMQYTGLKDKNGKEIYEGDVLSALRNEENDGWISSKLIHDPDYYEQVIYSNKIGGFVNQSDCLISKVIYNIVHKRIEHEIIGNIHENPELI